GRGSQCLWRTIHAHVLGHGPAHEEATGGLGIATGEVEKTYGSVPAKMFLDQLPKGLAGHVVPEVVRFEDRAIRGPPCCEQIRAGFITFLGHIVARFMLCSASSLERAIRRGCLSHRREQR